MSFPEDDTDRDGRASFEDGLMRLLTGAAFVVFQPLPVPNAPGHLGIADVEIIGLDHGGMAWCVPRGSLREAIRQIFARRIPEIVVMGFTDRPTPEAIVTARTSYDSAPALSIHFFDEGDLLNPE